MLLKPPKLHAHLSEQQKNELSEEIKRKFNWPSGPRDFQLKGICAQIEGTDMIIQASTGSGKTAIVAGPHIWAPCKGKITIMVSPLLALEEEMVWCIQLLESFSNVQLQVDTFNVDFGLKAIAVHGKNGGCSARTARVSQ